MFNGSALSKKHKKCQKKICTNLFFWTWTYFRMIKGTLLEGEDEYKTE